MMRLTIRRATPHLAATYVTNLHRGFPQWEMAHVNLGIYKAHPTPKQRNSNLWRWCWQCQWYLGRLDILWLHPAFAAQHHHRHLPSPVLVLDLLLWRPSLLEPLLVRLADHRRFRTLEAPGNLRTGQTFNRPPLAQ